MQLPRTLSERSLLPAIAGVAVMGVAILAALFAGKGGTPSGESPIADLPPTHVKVATGSTLILPLPEEMDTESVREHLDLPRTLSGTTTIEKDRIVFTPAGPMPLGMSYAFTLRAGAIAHSGMPLSRDRVYGFSVAGDPIASARLPIPDQTDVPTAATATITFDRPMVPLAAVHTRTETPGWDLPFTITPATAGTWKWMSTTTAEFTPDGGFAPGTRYAVSVPPGIRSLLGDTTTQDFSWSFATVRPRVIDIVPASGIEVGPTPEILLHWNIPMDLTSVREHLSLVSTSQPLVIRSVAYGKKMENGKEVRDESVIAITPASLPFGTLFTLNVSAGAQAVHGNLGLERDYETTIRTVGDFFVTGSSFEYGTFTVRFSAPLSEGKDIRSFLSLAPKPSDWENLTIEPQLWEDNRTVSFSPQMVPSTAYTLIVSPKLRDDFGRTMSKDHSFTVTTPPLAPQVMIPSKGEFGIFEKGHPPIFFVNAVNVSRLDFELAEVPLQEFLALRRAVELEYGYRPDLAKLPGYRAFSVTPKAGKNLWRVHPLDAAKELAPKGELRSGLYVLRVKAPEWKRWDQSSEELIQYFWLTNTALTLKYAGHEALVWATDLTTGEPIEGAQIAFHTLDGKKHEAGTTDRDGFFHTEIDIRALNSGNSWMPEFWVIARTGDDVALVGSTWVQGMQPWDFGFGDDFRSPESARLSVDTYLTTDRPVYRTGDTMSFKGVTRVRDERGMTLLPGSDRRMRVTIRNPEGAEIFHEEMAFSAFGSFAGSLPIAKEAKLGDYTLTAHLLPEEDTNGDEDATSFAVLAYRKPEYSVTVTAPKEQYVAGDTIAATISGRYYFGAPLAGAHVTWRATTQEYLFNASTDGWYAFGPESDWCWHDCPPVEDFLMEGEGTLDAQGQFTVRVPVTLEDRSLSQAVTIEAQVTDPSNQIVSNRETFPVHKAALYVGMKTKDYVVEPGEEAKIDVITVDPQGTPVPGRRVLLRLSRRAWNTIRKKSVDGEYYYDNEVEDTFIRSLDVTTGENGKATGNVRIPSGGQFAVEAVTRDDDGREAKASTSVYAWSDTYVNWPHTNADRIEVLADKPEYAIGETAKLLVKSPFQGKGVKALVTVEREGILSRRVIDVVSSAQPIEVPITAAMLPNAYVSVIIEKPRIGETFDDEGKDTGLPAFKIGSVNLPVAIAPRRLTLTLETDKERYLPGEPISVTVTAKDSVGLPARAEFSLAVVDRSVLALLGFSMPDPATFFWGQRGLGVRSAHMLLYLLDRFKPGSKGGGGGFEHAVRGDFKDTAYWNSAIVTDDTGHATVRFNLPQNLTTWHLLVEASTKEHQFGAIAHTVLATKHVIIRPVRPRFAVKDDQIDLGAIVHNFLGQEEAFAVTLSGSGFTARGSLQQTVTVAVDGNARLTFPITVTDPDRLTLRFSAQTLAARDPSGLPFVDAVEETIPVTLFGVPQTVATAGQVRGNAREETFLPREEDAGHISLAATISPTLATYLRGGLEYLVRFPYGCAEQTVSSFLPNVAIEKLQGFDAFRVADAATLKTNITAGLQRLARFQRNDGGFGYWEGSNESSPYLSAYVLFALEQTRSAGYSVDRDMTARARQYLQSVLRDLSPNNHIDLATRAYILAVLAEGGNVDKSLVQNLYDARKDLPLFGKAYLVLALTGGGRASAADPKVKTVLGEILSSAKVDARGTHFEEAESRRWSPLMHTNVRTSAIVLHTMLRTDPGNPEIPKIVRWLLSAREADHWDTTQSTTMTILALVEFLQATGELDANLTATVAVNGNDLSAHRFTAENVLTQVREEVTQNLLQSGARNTVEFRTEGEGLLYYDLVLQYLWKRAEIPPAEEGIGIRRDITPLTGSPRSPAVGGTYKVTLTVTVPEERHFVAIESPLPAGMEAIDFRLQTTEQNLAEEVNTEEKDHGWYWWDDPLHYFTHREFRDDQVFLFADNLPVGVYRYEYLMRATTPGRFQMRPARAYEMYFPEVFGQTAGEWISITD